MFTVLLCPYLFPLGIVFVKKRCGFCFYLCLTHIKHTMKIFFFGGGDQRHSGTYHTDGEQMQGVGRFAEAAPVWCEYKSKFRRRSPMLPGKKHAELNRTTERM